MKINALNTHYHFPRFLQKKKKRKKQFNYFVLSNKNKLWSSEKSQCKHFFKLWILMTQKLILYYSDSQPVHRSLRLIIKYFKIYRIFLCSIFHGIHGKAPWLNLILKGHRKKKFGYCCTIIFSLSEFLLKTIN